MDDTGEVTALLDTSRCVGPPEALYLAYLGTGSKSRQLSSVEVPTYAIISKSSHHQKDVDH